jgi:putative membrane protein
MNRNSLVVVGAAIIGCAAWLSAQTQNTSRPASQTASQNHSDNDTTKSPDHAFVTEAAMGGMAEVDLGRLASSQASHEKIKAFGQRMVTDHGKANDELKALASSKRVSVPASIDAKHQAMHDRFAKLSGAAFDRAYVRDMVADHKKDVAAFEHESMSGKDTDVKAWAAKMLPTLREHLRMIEELEKEITNTGATQ